MLERSRRHARTLPPTYKGSASSRSFDDRRVHGVVRAGAPFVSRAGAWLKFRLRSVREGLSPEAVRLQTSDRSHRPGRCFDRRSVRAGSHRVSRGRPRRRPWATSGDLGLPLDLVIDAPVAGPISGPPRRTSPIRARLPEAARTTAARKRFRRGLCEGSPWSSLPACWHGAEAAKARSDDVVTGSSGECAST